LRENAIESNGVLAKKRDAWGACYAVGNRIPGGG
jgi:hypothetical protein